MIHFDISEQDRPFYLKVMQRAKALVKKSKIDYPAKEMSMDLLACHSNGCPLDFKRFAEFPESDFGHDLFGIRKWIDRTTGKIPSNKFDPRCSKGETKAPKHLKVEHGLCDICGHHGNDCTGVKGGPPLKKFTVIGYFNDNDQVWVEWVLAITAEVAAIRGVEQVLRHDGNEEMGSDDVTVVGIFAGHHQELGKETYAVPGVCASQEGK